MTAKDYICAHLATRAWQDGREEGLNCMLAIAFTIRNRVRAGWHGGDWLKVIENHAQWSARKEAYTAELPDPRNFAFQCVLQEVTPIFEGSRRDDITVYQDTDTSSRQIFNQAAAPVALYYGRLDQITNDWFLENISRRSDLHPRIAQVGMMWFMA